MYFGKKKKKKREWNFFFFLVSNRLQRIPGTGCEIPKWSSAGVATPY